MHLSRAIIADKCTVSGDFSLKFIRYEIRYIGQKAVLFHLFEDINYRKVVIQLTRY